MMVAKRPQRIDPKLADDLRRAAGIRVNKNLARPIPQDISLSKMTELLTKTEGYKISLKELEFKPERRKQK